MTGMIEKQPPRFHCAQAHQSHLPEVTTCRCRNIGWKRTYTDVQALKVKQNHTCDPLQHYFGKGPRTAGFMEALSGPSTTEYQLNDSEKVALPFLKHPCVMRCSVWMPEVHLSAAVAATDDEAADTEPQEDGKDDAAAETAATADGSLISLDVQRPPETPTAGTAGTAGAEGCHAAQLTPAGASGVPDTAATPVAHVGSASGVASRGVTHRMSTASVDIPATPVAGASATAPEAAAAAAGRVAVQLDMSTPGDADAAPGVTLDAVPCVTPMPADAVPGFTPVSAVAAPGVTPVPAVAAPDFTPVSADHAPAVTPVSPDDTPPVTLDDEPGSTPVSADDAPGVTPVSAIAADDDSDATRDSGEAPGGTSLKPFRSQHTR